MRAPRPVAGLPVIDAADLAKAWLVALLEDAPLDRAPELATAAFAHDAPRLCAAFVAALADDVALARLRLVGATAGETAGAAGVTGVIRAVEALRAVTAVVLRGVADDPELHAAAHDRLAHVAAVLAEAGVAPPHPATPGGAASPLGTAVEPQAAAPPPGADPPGAIHAADRRDSLEALLASAVARHGEHGEPFALLAGEVADAERWLAADAAAVDAATAAVAAGLRPGDRLVVDTPGRWWVLAPNTDREAARALGTHLAEAVEAAGPAGAAFGTAACPHDGVDGDALMAHADEALLGARAAGLPVA